MKLILVADNPSDARLVTEMLADCRQTSVECDWTDRIAQALAWLAQNHYDVILLDLSLPGGFGVETLTCVQAAAPSVPIVVLSSLGDEGTALEALRRGAQDYLVKGFVEGHVLARSLRYAVERQRARDTLRRERDFTAAVVNAVGNLVVVLDADGRVASFNRACELATGYSQQEVLGKYAWETFLLSEDHRMCREILQETYATATPSEHEIVWRTKEGERRSVSCTSTALTGPDGSAGYVVFAGVDVTERVRADNESKVHCESLRKTLIETVNAISRTVETRDPYTAGHQRNVGRLASAIATELGLEEECAYGLSLAGMVHDIGKIGVPAEILAKPSRLNEAEFSLVRQHPQIGYDILKAIDFPWPIAAATLQHHERLDGSGYPAGIKGRDMTLEARILAVADVVEAMASHRPYRPALGVTTALEEIAQHCGDLYDTAVVKACLALFEDKGFILGDTGTKPRNRWSYGDLDFVLPRRRQAAEKP